MSTSIGRRVEKLELAAGAGGNAAWAAAEALIEAFSKKCLGHALPPEETELLATSGQADIQRAFPLAFESAGGMVKALDEIAAKVFGKAAAARACP